MTDAPKFSSRTEQIKAALGRNPANDPDAWSWDDWEADAEDDAEDDALDGVIENPNPWRSEYIEGDELDLC